MMSNNVHRQQPLNSAATHTVINVSSQPASSVVYVGGCPSCRVSVMKYLLLALELWNYRTVGLNIYVLVLGWRFARKSLHFLWYSLVDTAFSSRLTLPFMLYEKSLLKLLLFAMKKKQISFSTSALLPRNNATF